MIWTGAYIQNIIIDAGYRLEKVIQHYKLRQAATHDMGMLWNFTYFKDIKPDDTIIQEIRKRSEATIYMKIAVRNKSKDTNVYEVFTFNYWNNLTGTPHIMKYGGPKFLIYNTTSHYTKAIDAPHSTGIQEECSITD